MLRFYLFFQWNMCIHLQVPAVRFADGWCSWPATRWPTAIPGRNEGWNKALNEGNIKIFSFTLFHSKELKNHPIKYSPRIPGLNPKNGSFWTTIPRITYQVSQKRSRFLPFSVSIHSRKGLGVPVSVRFKCQGDLSSSMEVWRYLFEIQPPKKNRYTLIGLSRSPRFSLNTCMALFKALFLGGDSVRSRGPGDGWAVLRYHKCDVTKVKCEVGGESLIRGLTT